MPNDSQRKVIGNRAPWSREGMMAINDYCDVLEKIQEADGYFNRNSA